MLRHPSASIPYTTGNQLSKLKRKTKQKSKQQLEAARSLLLLRVLIFEGRFDGFPHVGVVLHLLARAEDAEQYDDHGGDADQACHRRHEELVPEVAD